MTETLPLNEIRVGDRFRKETGDLTGLAESIAAVGLLNPILVTSEHVLVAGFRRMEAIKTLGWETVPVRVLDLDELLLRAEHDENVVRKDFAITERAAIAEALEKREKELAQQRQKEGAKRGGQKQGSSKSGEGKKAGEAKTVAAKAAGMSATTWEKAAVVMKAAAEDPDRFAHLPAEMDRTGKVDPFYKKVMAERDAEGAQQPKKPLSPAAQLAAMRKSTARLMESEPLVLAEEMVRLKRRDEAVEWAIQMEDWVAKFHDAVSGAPGAEAAA